MSCKNYNKYENGKLDIDEFKAHIKRCGSCSELYLMDQKILDEAGKLKVEVSAPQLWNRIQADLYNASKEIESRRPALMFRLLNFPVPIKLILFLGLLTLIIYKFVDLSPAPKSGNLLSETGLAQVQSLESEYISAIKQLEKQVYPKIQRLEKDLAAKYTERLQIIDEQIRICRAEIDANPVNTHIRRYLLKALIDKKATLLVINRFNEE